MIVSELQIQSLIDKLGAVKATSVFTDFFNSYRTSLSSYDVREVYSREYYENLAALPTINDDSLVFPMNIYSEYSYRYVVKSLEKEAANVIDIGCGHAHFLLNLALRFPESNFVGIDISEESIRAAQEKAKNYNIGNVIFKCCSADEFIDFGLADIIVFNDVTEHLADSELDKIFLCVATWCKDDAVVVIHTPNALALCNGYETSLIRQCYLWYLSCIKGWSGFSKSAKQLYYEQMHINVKSYKSLAAFLSKYGFECRVQYDSPQKVRLLDWLSPNMLVVASRIPK
ncbi:class I SAM-dependent methyltransferase [Oleidesulfovibrio sp.]|uniref:class I SAM-dependent methyltransferase n=1 Tax=Oleidesulfovibrio sp. TaxID=2909707 RepID=UPI003A871076